MGARRRAGGQMRRWVLTEREDRTWRVLREAAAGRDQTCAIPLPEIARRSGVCRRTAVEHLRRLEQLGRIRRISGGRGRGNVTVYRAPRDFRRSSWERWEREKVQPEPTPSPSSPLGGETVPRAGVSAPQKAGGSPPGRWWHLSELDLVDREARDATYLRLADLGAIADPCEQRREQWHGLVARARRKAVNVLAFVAGVVRRGLWRVVGEQDREFARDEIRALDGLGRWAVQVPAMTDPEAIGNLLARLDPPRQIRRICQT